MQLTKAQAVRAALKQSHNPAAVDADSNTKLRVVATTIFRKSGGDGTVTQSEVSGQRAAITRRVGGPLTAEKVRRYEALLLESPSGKGQTRKATRAARVTKFKAEKAAEAANGRQTAQDAIAGHGGMVTRFQAAHRLVAACGDAKTARSVLDTYLAIVEETQ